MDIRSEPLLLVRATEIGREEVKLTLWARSVSGVCHPEYSRVVPRRALSADLLEDLGAYVAILVHDAWQRWAIDAPGHEAGLTMAVEALEGSAPPADAVLNRARP